MSRFTDRRRRTVVGAVGLVAALALVVASCSSGASDDSSSTTAAAAPTDYSGYGPYPVGTAKLTISDGQAVYLYYPADPARLDEGTPVTGYASSDAFPEAFRAIAPAKYVQQIPLDATLDAPVADGPYPLVLFSHGFGVYPEYSAQRLAHMASWGLVTAAPDHTSRDVAAVFTGTVTSGDDDLVDLRETLQLVRDQAAAGGRLDGAVNFDQVAAVGHSAGGSAGAQLLSDPAIKTFVGWAPASPLDLQASGGIDEAGLVAAYARTEPPQKPTMLIAGERDGIIPLAAVDAEFDWLAPPKRYAVLANAGHNAFTDLCTPILAQGGLGDLATLVPSAASLVKAADDGCTAGYLDPETGYRVIDHLTTAQLRWVFGLDPTDASLTSEYVDSLFPGALSRYEFEGSTEAGQG
jgi:pimeloyl-ACP methyl ester carboxylesterase